MKLSKLLCGLETSGYNPDNIEISGIAYDSRSVKKGDVFVCIKGYATDGHKYVKNAIQNGAAAIVASDKIEVNIPVIYTPDTRLALAYMSKAYFNNPLESIKLIGVTGTNGKTTVTYLIKSMLEAQGIKVGLIGTNQNMIGDKVIPTERTTPESFELYKLFAQMADEGADCVVMEVSSHALELCRVAGCEFDTAVFTNLTQDHLDFHENMENYFMAKSKLFSVCKNAVINIDDEYGRRLAKMCGANVMTYAINSDADMRASLISVDAKGVCYDLCYNNNKYKARLSIPGRFSVYNSLASLGAVITLRADINSCLDELSKAKEVKGRAEIVGTDTDFTVIIDYAHTPDGLENILSTVNEFKKGRLITLFGCGGDRDKTKRPKMGKTAGELSDFLVVTSDNPRSEEPDKIIDDIMDGVIESGCEYVRIENRRDAIEYALTHAKKDDIIVLAGKGHETYQILKDGTIHFDEREVVYEVLEKK
ncbi:MAG: UDP-N-acetylmuramoyl-L-alanyl-D-glutamate--2,6-diaminopimelate ligase [Ruminococcaceae bacterium]|nr:UDP-N-acetylmuramoyl-L-alanyl-D-glutamate--2,6-diaminopimelate ligase [Oscillospiraceae bacterium]